MNTRSCSCGRCHFPIPRRAAIALAMLVMLARLACAPSAAFPKGDDTTYTVKPLLKGGVVDRYTLVLHGTVNIPQTHGDDMDFTLTVKLKEATHFDRTDGTPTVTDTVEQATLKLGHQELEVTPFLVGVVQTLDKQGRLCEIEQEKSSQISSGSSDYPFSQGIGMIIQQVFLAQRALYPSKPVKVGEPWKIEPLPAKLNSADPDTNSEGTATFISKETVSKLETFKVKVVLDTSVAGPVSQKAYFEGFGNIEAKNGEFVKLVGTLSGNTGPVKKGDFAFTRETAVVASDDEPYERLGGWDGALVVFFDWDTSNPRSPDASGGYVARFVVLERSVDLETDRLTRDGDRLFINTKRYGKVRVAPHVENGFVILRQDGTIKVDVWVTQSQRRALFMLP